MRWYVVTKTEVIRGCCHFAGYIDGVQAKSAAFALVIAKIRNPMEGGDFVTVSEARQDTAYAARIEHEAAVSDFRELMDAILER